MHCYVSVNHEKSQKQTFAIVGEEAADRTGGAGPKVADGRRERSRRCYDAVGGVH